VGEFLEMLRRLDPAQAERLEEGYREVLELLGERAGGGSGRAAGSPSSSSSGGEGGGSGGDPPSGLGVVERLFLEALGELRVLPRVLPVTRLGPGVDYVAEPRVVLSEQGVVVEGEQVLPLEEVSVEFLVPRRLLERSGRLGEGELAPVVRYAASRMAVLEEKLIVDRLLSLEKERGAGMRGWEAPGEAVEDVARALAELESEGIRGPWLLLVPPQRYARLLQVSERAGVMELARLEKLVGRVVRAASLPHDRAVLLAADPAVADLVVGVEPRVEEIGPEPGGYRYRAWETVALRIRNPRGVLVLAQG